MIEEKTATASLDWDRIAIGDALLAHVSPRISRTVLALFAGGSGDHNPIHIDIDFAKKYGMPDVFAHGMLSMAYLAQLITNWARQDQIRSYAVRFAALTPVQARATCTGRITDKFEEAGERRVRIELQTALEDGTVTLIGDAVIALA
jgi:acyl dehydratase